MNSNLSYRGLELSHSLELFCIPVLHWGRRETQEGRSRFAFLCCISSCKLLLPHLIFSSPSSISFNKSSHSQFLWSHPGPAHLLSCPERCLLSSRFIRLWAAPPSNKHQQRPARSPSCQFANQPTQRPSPHACLPATALPTAMADSCSIHLALNKGCYPSLLWPLFLYCEAQEWELTLKGVYWWGGLSRNVWVLCFTAKNIHKRFESTDNLCFLQNTSFFVSLLSLFFHSKLDLGFFVLSVFPFVFVPHPLSQLSQVQSINQLINSLLSSQFPSKRRRKERQDEKKGPELWHVFRWCLT